MALYVVKLQIPANTPVNSPVTATVEIEEDILVRLTALFPPGCLGQVGTSLFYGLKQIWPLPEGSWLVGDGEPVTSEERIELPEVPCELTVKGYNVDPDYDHTVFWRITAQMHEYVDFEKPLKRALLKALWYPL